MLLVGAIRGGSDAPPILLAITFSAVVGWFWFVALIWVSYEIRLTASGELEFVSVLRTLRTKVADVKSVRSAMGGLDPYTIVFTFAGGKARAIRQMDGLHKLMQRLVAQNPAIDVRGV